MLPRNIMPRRLARGSQRLAVRRLCARAISSDGVGIAWQQYTPKGLAEDSRPPLLLVQGFACGKDDWGALTKMLASKSKRTVITFDHRGIGESDVPAGPYAVTDLAADALAVLDAAAAPKAHVLGISLGGMVAQSLALDQPARVRSLVLGCTTHGGREATPPPRGFMELCAAWSAEGDTATGTGIGVTAPDDPNASPLVPEFIRFMLPPTTSAERLEHYREYFAKYTRRSRTGLRGQLAAMGRFNTTKRLAELGQATPTLVLCGSEDAVMPLANSESLHARTPNSRLLVTHGAGHFWWAHDPVYVVSEVAKFLQDAEHMQSGEQGGA